MSDWGRTLIPRHLARNVGKSESDHGESREVSPALLEVSGR
jgi:hypothetical protein